MNSSIGRSYHASAPYSSKTDAARSTSAGVRIASPHLVQSTAGIGTPQARWREMHQSGRFDSMLKRRSRPHAGIHVTSRSMASSAGLPQRLRCRPRRSTGSPSIRMNHCDVARKITGLWQRQQCGYWCAKSARCHSRPRSFSACSMCGLASNTRCPPNSSTVSRKCPPGPDRRVDLEAVAHAGVEVVRAVARRRVDRAGAGVERDVVAQHAERDARVERVLEADAARAARP